MQLEPSTTPRTPEITSTETEVTPIDSVVTAALVEGQPQIVSEAEKVLQVILCQKDSFLHQLSQNDDRLFVELQDQCDKTTSLVDVFLTLRTIWGKYTTCTEPVIQWTNSRHSLGYRYKTLSSTNFWIPKVRLYVSSNCFKFLAALWLAVRLLREPIRE